MSDSVLPQLAATLRDLIAAHRDLIAALIEQHAALRSFDAPRVAELVARQERVHRRLMRLEAERRRRSEAAARALGLRRDATLADVAARSPASADELLALRTELRQLSVEAAERGRRCGRIAGTALANLGSALRRATGATLYRPGGDFALPPPIRRTDAVA